MPMLSFLAATLAIASGTPTANLKLEDQFTECFSKLAKSASNVGEDIGFTPGLCLLGGYLSQGATMTWNRVVSAKGIVGILTEAPGNDSEIEVNVVAPNGEEVVLDAADDWSTFEAEGPGRYTIRVKNVGASCYIAMGFLVAGGVKMDSNSILVVANRLSGALDTVMEDKFQFGKNSFTCFGSVLKPGAQYQWGTPPRATNWAALAVSDHDEPGALKLTVFDAAKEPIAEDNGEAHEHVSVFNKNVPNGNINMTNKSSDSILALGTVVFK